MLVWSEGVGALSSVSDVNAIQASILVDIMAEYEVAWRVHVPLHTALVVFHILLGA